MKRLFNFILVSCMAILLTGCRDSLADIFNGNDKNVIAPAELNSVSANEWDLLKNNNNEGLNALISSVLVELDAKASSVENGYLSKYKEDYATIINDDSLLKDVRGYDGNTYSRPEIDFCNYSLLLGRFFTYQSGFRLENQRIIQKNNIATLYLDIRKEDNEYNLMAIWEYYFAALYPKLDCKTVEIVRWDNY